MTLTFKEPPASADAVDHADYLEVLSLRAKDRNASLIDVRRGLSRSGGIEVIEDGEEMGDDDGDGDIHDSLVDPGGEEAEAITDELAGEVDERLLATLGAYPFIFDGSTVQSNAETDKSIYTFLLLTSAFGVTVGPHKKEDTTQLFEDIAAVAAEGYFGGPHERVTMSQFGFPRRVTPSKFPDAIDDLCVKLGEGVGSRKRPTTKNQKDARLDVVVARHFPDRRGGQLIGFGQCAAGRTWKTKLTDLQPKDFCRLWMKDTPAVEPIRMFFTPNRVTEEGWYEVAVMGGVLFDRCRLVFHAVHAPKELLTRCAAWNKPILSELRS